MQHAWPPMLVYRLDFAGCHVNLGNPNFVILTKDPMVSERG